MEIALISVECDAWIAEGRITMCAVGGMGCNYKVAVLNMCRCLCLTSAGCSL